MHDLFRSHRRSLRRASRALVAAALTSLCFASPALAAGDDPVPTPTPGHAAGGPSAESLVNDGIARAKRGEWAQAEASHRAAIALSPELPEAWNGLGHALKNQKRFDESLAAYQEALRLRPRYPQALEYMGETYVMMGRYKDAEKVLARLRPLDRQLAAQLESSIVNRTQRAASW
jgi:Flp pilus assembly protein TadD